MKKETHPENGYKNPCKSHCLADVAEQRIEKAIGH